MPYSKISELPKTVKDRLSTDKQRQWMAVFNEIHDRTKSEGRAMAGANAAVKKASGAKPLYIKRCVLNAESIINHFKMQGVQTMLEPDDMHVTIIYSKEPFSQYLTTVAEEGGDHGSCPVSIHGGKRSMEMLGENNDVLVMKIESAHLAINHYSYRSQGAASDWPDYKPHITLTYKTEDIPATLVPYPGMINLGPEVVSILDPDWKSTVTEKSAKGLKNKVEEFNEKYGAKHGRVTMSMLRQVYDRGVGAYKTNPSSVRPSVTSPEQWAMARVNSFLSAARGAKKINHDQDIHDKINKTTPSMSSVHVPNADDKLRKAEGFTPPESAKNNAKRVLRWKEEHGSEVNGMTSVGWNRARQLASGDSISLETVKRMAQFARHKKNSKIDPKHEGTPWKDAGYVAWLGWGGDSGIAWAKRISDRETEKATAKRQMGDDQYSTAAEARAASHGLGLQGTVHVFDTEDGALYMPGNTHEDYLEAKAQQGGIDPEPEEHEEASDDSLERAVRTIMDSVMSKAFTIQADVVKAEQQIAYGWASVVSVDGENLVDKQGHIITSEEMEKMANTFMMSQRVAKEMHTGGSVGEVIHSMPITNQLMKSLGIEGKTEGWLIGVKINDPDVWKRVKDGTLKAFSIGGKGKLTDA